MSRPTLQVSCNFGGRHSGEEGANAHPCQHAVPVSVTVTADGQDQVRQFVGGKPPQRDAVDDRHGYVHGADTWYHKAYARERAYALR